MSQCVIALITVSVVLAGVVLCAVGLAVFDSFGTDPATTPASSASSTGGPTTTSVPTSPSRRSSASAKGPATSFGNGTWLAGRDFQPDTYRSAGPTVQNGYCIWEREQHAGGEGTILEDSSQGPAEVAINAGEYFVSSYCQTWTQVA